jgi:hypothetical protein
VTGVDGPLAIAGPCALVTGGSLVCWTPAKLVAVPVDGVDQVVAIAADGEGGRLCATRATGDVWCWPQPVFSETPTKVSF